MKPLMVSGGGLKSGSVSPVDSNCASDELELTKRFRGFFFIFYQQSNELEFMENRGNTIRYE